MLHLNIETSNLRERIRRRISLTRQLRSVNFRTRRLIVFLTPGCDAPSGGPLAINGQYRESVKLRDIHHAKVVLCTVPGDPWLPKYTWFDNDSYILELERVLARCGQLEHLLIHIPEYAVNQVSDWARRNSETLTAKAKEIHFNVLLQNIDLIEGQRLADLQRFGKVTCTTAHDSYTSLEYREALGVPLHKLGCYNDLSFFPRTDYHKKASILMVSPDPDPRKAEILEHLAKALPELTIQVVENLHYEEYKKLIRRAKWSLTFGEGMDSYFNDLFSSGGVGFAVFNDRFFPQRFAALETVYASWDELKARIVSDIKRLDEPAAYKRCSQSGYDILIDIINADKFLENLRNFYRGEYTLP